VIVLVIVAVLVIALITFLIVRRQRYIRDLRGRGWSFDSNPALEWVLDHHVPPFGLGFVRKVDEGVSGTVDGIAFRVFEYTCTEGGPKFDERLATLQLPLALPELFVCAGKVRSGVRPPPVDLDPNHHGNAGDPGYARAALGGAALGAIAAFGRAGHPVDLSVDGAHLVAVGAPKDPDELQAYLELLAPVARAVDPSILAPYAVAPIQSGFTFYGHPDWLLVGRDDSLIGKYGLTTVGFGHTTEKVIRGYNDGLPIEAFIHRWKTEHTETSTDSQGRTQTRTVTDQHSEVVAAVSLPFAFPLLSVNGGWGGKRVKFEGEEFNDQFAVRTDDAKFAYDVIHPRTMEFLMARRPPGFRIEGNLMRYSVSEHDTAVISVCADFAHEFFGRVPSFVWRDLQITPPAFRSSS